MIRKEKLYEGKAKIIYATDNPDVVIQYFKDDATAFNAQKKGTIQKKGIFNNRISSKLFQLIESQGIETHFVEYLSEREMAVKTLEIVKVEVVVRNIVAGSLSKRLGIPEGEPISRPIIEFYYKDDELGDPMITEEHVLAFHIATQEEIDFIKRDSFKINQILLEFFKSSGIDLVDFKLEYGRHKGKLLLGDEISPDSCRLWDSQTKEKLDKDRFRRDLGKIEEAYERIYNVVG